MRQLEKFHADYSMLAPDDLAGSTDQSPRRDGQLDCAAYRRFYVRQQFCTTARYIQHLTFVALDVVVERYPSGMLPLPPLIRAPLCQNGHPLAYRGEMKSRLSRTFEFSTIFTKLRDPFLCLAAARCIS